jgi:cytochrome c biogenesis protein CcmG, thiol:disulfide interchange protein DsbE
MTERRIGNPSLHRSWVVFIIESVRRWFSGILVLLVLAGGCDRGDHPRQIGNAAPHFNLVDGQQTLDLNAYRGKVVVLNFWATWCTPCIEEIPSLNQLQRDMPQLAIVGVSVDQNGNAYRQFLVDHQIAFTTIRDPDRRISELYGTQQFPETYVIDRSGRVRRKFVNAQDWTSPEIVTYLSHL